MWAPLALRCANCGTQLPAGAKFCFECATPVSAQATQARLVSPDSYTPKHLAEKILAFKAALEGERKQVTVLFDDVKGSMELLADPDPEEACKTLEPVLERMMEAVHHYEGTVNQVMGGEIMTLFGAPPRSQDHAVRACYSALTARPSVAGGSCPQVGGSCPPGTAASGALIQANGSPFASALTTFMNLTHSHSRASPLRRNRRLAGPSAPD
jgi:hypothetical protein